MSMSKLKRRAPAALGKNPKLDKEEEETTPQTEKSMHDLPPEVLTIILEHAILNQRRNNMLVYRLVSCQWKDIVDSLLEKEVISRRLQDFPAMKIGGQSDQLSVYYPQRVFRAGRNPLAFNSLLLNGDNRIPHGPADNQMAVAIFMSKFGSNLTTFALQNQIIGTISLAAMLRSMSNLKVLCFQDVELTRRSIGPGGILQQPPPLPSLITLELKSESYYGEKDDKRNTLYVWLLASYADQLVHLTLNTGDSLPALQKGHEYCIPWRSGEKVSVATTSDSAFGKLKELNVCHPSPQFLRFTQTPALQHLSIPGWTRVDLRDLKTLIGTCGSTLRDISVDIFWEDLDSGEPIQTLPSAGVVGRNVKKLTLNVSFDYYHLERKNFDKTTLSLLSMFPVLDVIQLLHYKPYELGCQIALYDGQNQGSNLKSSNESNAAHEIISLKQRFTSLREAASGRRGDDDFDFEKHFQAWNERRAVLKRLATLGVNVNQVIVEEMLEQQGVWNVCPNLKTVSVSSGGKPVGDICMIQRMDDD